MTPNKLPPLPEPSCNTSVFCYTAGDLQAYAREHEEALHQSQSLPAGAVAGLVGKWRDEAAAFESKACDPEVTPGNANWLAGMDEMAARCADELEKALQADAREKGEAKPHDGACGPETSCDSGCADAYYAAGETKCKTCNGKGFIRAHGLPWPDDEIPCPHPATQPAQASEAMGDAARLDWIASQCRTPTVYMSGMYEFSANHKMRRLIGQTFRQAIDRAMANENEPTYQAGPATSSQETASE